MDTLHELSQVIHNNDLMDVASRMHKSRPMLDDIPWYEASDVTSHRFAYDTTLPAGDWRAYNEGINVETWTGTQARANIGLLESLSQVDKGLYDINPNPDKYRSQRDLRFAEGMGQTLSTAVLYGDEGLKPNSFNGVTKFFASLSAEGVYNAGADSGENGYVTDIFIVQWGQEKVWMAYPRGAGATMGFGRTSYPERMAAVASGGFKPVLETRFTFNCGMVVENPRCIKRIANLSTLASGDTGKFDEDFLIEALNDMPNEGAGAVIYMPRNIKTQLDIRAKDKGNAALGWTDIFGRRVLTFWGTPIRVDESIATSNNVLA